jgi:FAD/FMN-containing dehydrogenase
VKNDVSVPVSKVPAFIREATAACEALMPGIRVVPFGHMGDGNIHFNLEQPVAMDGAAFLARDHDIMDTVCAVVRKYDGSFSAEHGIGRLKPYMMPDWRGGAELAVMQRIKAAMASQEWPHDRRGRAPAQRQQRNQQVARHHPRTCRPTHPPCRWRSEKSGP